MVSLKMMFYMLSIRKEGEKSMNFLGFTGFLGGVLYYACLAVVLTLVMIAGILIGKMLRDRKDAKKINIDEKETTITE